MSLEKVKKLLSRDVLTIFISDVLPETSTSVLGAGQFSSAIILDSRGKWVSTVIKLNNLSGNRTGLLSFSARLTDLGTSDSIPTSDDYTNTVINIPPSNYVPLQTRQYPLPNPVHSYTQTDLPQHPKPLPKPVCLFFFSVFL